MREISEVRFRCVRNMCEEEITEDRLWIFRVGNTLKRSSRKVLSHR